MIITTHVLAGAAIGARTSHLSLALIFGLASHYLLDAIPHWDYLDEFTEILNRKGFIKTIIDFIIGFILVLIFICSCYDRMAFISIAVLASILPDFIEFIYKATNFRILEPLSRFHRRIHAKKELSFKKALPINLFLILLSIFLLIKSCCII